MDFVSLFFFESFVVFFEFYVIEQFFDNFFFFIVFLVVVFFEDFVLFGSSDCEGLVDQLGVFVIFDISVDFVNVFGKIKVVKVVVLDLEVFVQRNEDVFSLFEVFGGGEVELVESESDGEVEGVVCGFVYDDEVVFFYGEVVKVDFVFGGSEEIVKLVYFGLECNFVEKFNKVNVGGVCFEEVFEQRVDVSFEYESVVDGNYIDIFLVVLVGFVMVGNG